MKPHEMEMLAAADPIGPKRLDAIDLRAMEAELLADLDDEQSASPSPQAEGILRHRPRRLALAAGVAAVAAVLVAVVLLAGGTPEHPSRAYAAEVVRFAESTPLLLLDGPDWRVQNVTEMEDSEGTMEFVTGKPIPYETIQMRGNLETGQRAYGVAPASVRQRKVELAWRHGSLAKWLAYAHDAYHVHGEHWTQAPVLETTADVDTRAEVFVNLGGPGDRTMAAYWAEDGYVLEMRAAVPDLAAFEERLAWLTRVDSQTWLDAMPARVVKAADHNAAVREMLKGIPVPAGFRPSQIPDAGLTTNRYQVGASVTGTVSCLWFLQWGEARRSGDRAAAAEAERAMATARHWPILHEMARDGAYPTLIWELAAAMPRGYWQWAGHHRRLLPHAEGLGCARLGLPLLLRKQRLQRERAGG